MPTHKCMVRLPCSLCAVSCSAAGTLSHARATPSHLPCLCQAGARHGHHVHAACGARDELLHRRGASLGVLWRRCLHCHRWCGPALHSLHCPLILRPLSICLSNQWLGGYACRFCCDSCGYPGRRRLCKRSAPSVILGQGHRAELAHAVQRLLTQSCLQYGGSIAEGWRMQAWQTRCILATLRQRCTCWEQQQLCRQHSARLGRWRAAMPLLSRHPLCVPAFQD